MREVNSKRIFLFILSSIIVLISTENLTAEERKILSQDFNNWVEIRNKNLVKQDTDYSCGAASIATVLSNYYNIKTTEKEVLKTA